MSKQTIVSPSVGDMEQINQDNISLWSKIHLASDFLDNATEITGQQYVIVTREEYNMVRKARSLKTERLAPLPIVKYTNIKKKKRGGKRK